MFILESFLILPSLRTAELYEEFDNPRDLIARSIERVQTAKRTGTIIITRVFDTEKEF